MSPARHVSLAVAVLGATLCATVPSFGADAGPAPRHDAGATHGALAGDADASSADASDAAPEADASAPGATGVTVEDAGAADGERIWASCMEHIPDGATRPKLEESFPDRGYSGYALPLHVVVHHGKGETVLPDGFHVQRDSDAARAIEAAGFAFPSPDGGSAPSLTRRADGQGAVTELTIPFVALPPTPGRHELTIPPVPIAIARASGDLMTLCTQPHVVTVDDPTANEPEAAPKGNPGPRRQREEWTVARDLTYGVAIGAAAAAVLTWLVLRWLRRPRPAPPPPPPRPPWEIALEELAALRHSTLLESGQIAEHVDRVSDTTRRYLGSLYGFDGIESTTDEAMAALGQVSPPFAHLETVRALLADCDLVKFARWLPTSDDCIAMLDRAERLVNDTMPHAAPQPVLQAPPPSPPAPPAAPAPSPPGDAS